MKFACFSFCEHDCSYIFLFLLGTSSFVIYYIQFVAEFQQYLFSLAYDLGNCPLFKEEIHY